jgi:hypothetical protein
MYDLVLLGFVGFYLAFFIAGMFIFFPEVTAETAIIRATLRLHFCCFMSFYQSDRWLV